MPAGETRILRSRRSPESPDRLTGFLRAVSLPPNAPALAFWRRVVGEYAGRAPRRDGK